MTFDEYQVQSSVTAEYPLLGYNAVYPAMGLAGEAGEVLDKIKKHWRNYCHIHGYKDADNVAYGMNFDTFKGEELAAIQDELGDTLWYMAALCRELHIDFDSVAKRNIEKLMDRKNRGVVCSQGDNR